ncbi:MAG: AMP-binding protein, partial [Spirochaetales bacterium]|nr:AMP-binding protein [Spirochaetales bacterium]
MYNSILEIPFETAAKYPGRISHQFRTRSGEEKISFADFTRFIRVLTAGFGRLGIKKSDHVGFFMNNRYEWISTDMALMALGAVSVPRGSDTTAREIQFIYKHSDSAFLILENMKQLHDIIPVFEKDDWKQCQKIIVLEAVEDEDLPKDILKMLVSYAEIISMGEEALTEDPDQVERLMKEVKKDDLLTIVYTSGTTGNPKGVMLTHRNFLQNVEANTPRLEIDPEKAERTVVMLPSWHVYERTFEYCAMVCVLTIVYSSAGRFASDLLRIKPEIIISVPRVWESIYQKLIRAMSEMGFVKRNLIFFFVKVNQVYLSSRHYLKGCYIRLSKRSVIRRSISWFYHLLLFILMTPGHYISRILFKPFRDKVGGRLRGATSAAGSLPKYLDELFNALGIRIANAYGMTECAPGILSRTFDRNTFGSTGVPFDNTEVEIRREDGSPADIGEKGVLYCRGPQVMKGYYKNPEATAAVLDSEGWL